jgi:hypothetical protein
MNQLRMDNSEKLATLDTQDTGQRQTKPHHYTQMLSFDNSVLKMVIFKHSVILFRCSIICRWPEP